MTTNITNFKWFHFLLKDFEQSPYAMELLYNMEILYFAIWKGSISSFLSNLLQYAVQQGVLVRVKHEYKRIINAHIYYVIQ